MGFYQQVERFDHPRRIFAALQQQNHHQRCHQYCLLNEENHHLRWSFGLTWWQRLVGGQRWTLGLVSTKYGGNV